VRAAVGVQDAIHEADTVLPGEPVDEGSDPRWQAIIRVGEFIESDPEPVWQFILRWGVHPQEDLRKAIATCLLEHLLEHHFERYFPEVERAALADPMFGDTFQRCWQFGQAKEAGNAERFVSLTRRLETQDLA
jgi:hypothetical protein